MDLIAKKKLCAALAIYHIYRKKMTKRKRSLYIRKILRNRSGFGEMVLVKELADDPTYHFNYFR
jgi:hypothetical protein